ncbi:MAG: tetratricopeptide repeat protein, partial [Moorea sp. SIO4G2]|nr:tetratricopeptide repeat protein [Moorena sp. SIO4G2]
LEINKRLFGEEHPDLATILYNLATILHNQGRQTEAESLYQQALEIAVKQLGEEHPITRIILKNLKELLNESGETWN